MKMSTSATEISHLHQEVEDDDDQTSSANSVSYQHLQEHYNNDYNTRRNTTATTTGVISTEIEEEEEEEEENSSDLFEINHGAAMEGSLFSFDVHNHQDYCVYYVGVGKSESSMDALSWTLKNIVADDDANTNSNTMMVYLIHVFPEIHHIPSPLGKLPKSQVNPEQVDSYMAQEGSKRRQLLQRFINMCSASKVKVDTVLIESDMVGKAILDLIPILNMRKLVLGISKSNLRKIRSRKGTGIIADYVLQNAPEFCQVKIICDGKEEAIDHMTGSPSPRPDEQRPKFMQLPDQSNTNTDSFISCMCFKSPKAM